MGWDRLLRQPPRVAASLRHKQRLDRGRAPRPRGTAPPRCAARAAACGDRRSLQPAGRASRGGGLPGCGDRRAVLVARPLRPAGGRSCRSPPTGRLASGGRSPLHFWWRSRASRRGATSTTRAAEAAARHGGVLGRHGGKRPLAPVERRAARGTDDSGVHHAPASSFATHLAVVDSGCRTSRRGLPRCAAQDVGTPASRLRRRSCRGGGDEANDPACRLLSPSRGHLVADAARVGRRARCPPVRVGCDRGLERVDADFAVGRDGGGDSCSSLMRPPLA